MSMALSSAPRTALDRTCINIVKAEDQPCNVTEDNNNRDDCYESMHAFKKIRTSTSGLRKSPNKWTKEENQKLASLVASYGEKKWKRISAEMGGQKTGAQCAQHWKRVLSPEIRKGHWDENEEDLLLRLVVQYGSCWKKIAKKIPQRTDIQCRYQYLKAKQSREVMWDGKEDESLVKKVMEVANCNYFQILNELGSSSSSSTTATTTTSSLPSPSSPSSSDGSPSLSSQGSQSGSPALSSPMSMSDSPLSAVPRFSLSPLRASPLSGSPLRSPFSPMQNSPSANHSIHRLSSDARHKENDDALSGNSSSNGSSSGSEEECTSMKMSGEMSKFAWNDDKHNVNMSDSTEREAGGNNNKSSWRSPSGNNLKDLPLSESLCANCHSPFISHINKVVWLEISEHMARLKLTSTLRTALECKTRFTELLGNKIPFAGPSQFSNGMMDGIKATGLKNSGEMGRNGLRGSGGVSNTEGSKGFHNSLGDANNIKINNPDNKMSTSTAPRYNGSNINLTNCNNNNITINITNSYTTTNTLQNGIHYQQLTHTTSSTTGATMKGEMMKGELMKGELMKGELLKGELLKGELLKGEPLMGPSQLLAKAPVLSPAPPFPSFTLPSHPSLPSLPSFSHISAPQQLKPPPTTATTTITRSVPSGLESLAAVASILPREMLADYF